MASLCQVEDGTRLFSRLGGYDGRRRPCNCRKLGLAHWLRMQVDDQLSDDVMIAITAEGARASDKREAEYAKRK